MQTDGCTQVVPEKVSSGKERLALQHLLALLQRGSTRMTWKLDRLGRSLKDLVKRVTGLSKSHAVSGGPRYKQ